MACDLTRRLEGGCIFSYAFIMMNKTAIIIPSYKEYQNLSILIKEIKKNIPQAAIIIVDDSPKKENAILKRSIKNSGEIISRYKKLGRGSAILAGFTRAMLNKNIEYFFEMDADLTHDPSQCQKFISYIKKNNVDVVVGSRYLRESKFINLPKHRTIISRIINRFLFIALGVSSSDYTSGFRLYNRKAVTFLVKQHVLSKGFILLSEILYRLHRNNFQIGEVPIIVYKRKFGQSTLTISEFVTSLVIIGRLRFIEKDILYKS